MITIIHGNDTSASRTYFLGLQKKIIEPVVINGRTASLTDLVQDFEGGGLFSEPKHFFIEELLGKRKKSSELDAITSYINKMAAEHDIFLWEEKELTTAVLKLFKNAKIMVFKLPQSLFLFLDSIRPNNGKSLIKLFHDTIQTTDPEMVFFMIIRQIRLLLALSDPANSEIDELRRMAPWQKTKLQQQARQFSKDSLQNIYAKLFVIEKGLKTGTLSLNVEQAIDLLLLDI